MDLTWLFVGIGIWFVSFVVAGLNIVLNRADNKLVIVHVLSMIGMVSGGLIIVVNIVLIIVHYLDALVK